MDYEPPLEAQGTVHGVAVPASRCPKHKLLEPCPRREGKPGPC